MGLFYCNLSSFSYTVLFPRLNYTHTRGLRQVKNRRWMKLNRLCVKQFVWNNLRSKREKLKNKKFYNKNFGKG